MDKVRKQNRNVSVSYYDYRKECNNVHHDWMFRVYDWIGMPKDVVLLLCELMKRWKTKLEVWDGNENSVTNG